MPFRTVTRHNRTFVTLFAGILLSLTALFMQNAQAEQQKPAANSHWQMVTLRGEAQIDPSITTLDIGKDQRISGNTGCNRFTGTIIGGSDGLFGKLATTRMACPSPVDKQEQGFLKAMGKAMSWSVDTKQNQLVLRDGDHKVLAVFIPRQDPEYFYDCQGKHAHVVLHSRSSITLDFDGQSLDMNRSTTASGSKFEGHGMSFWGKGKKGTLTLKDGSTLDCTLVPPPKDE